MEPTWIVVVLALGFLAGYASGGPTRLKKREWDIEAISDYAKYCAKKMECPHCNELVDLRHSYVVPSFADSYNEAVLVKHEDDEDESA